MKKLIFSVFLFLALAENASAQCAMCRSTLENNFSNGDPGIAAGINTGILYLLILPYLTMAVLGYLWHKTTKNGAKELDKRVA